MSAREQELGEALLEGCDALVEVCQRLVSIVQYDLNNFNLTMKSNLLKKHKTLFT